MNFGGCKIQNCSSDNLRSNDILCYPGIRILMQQLSQFILQDKCMIVHHRADINCWSATDNHLVLQYSVPRL